MGLFAMDNSCLGPVCLRGWSASPTDTLTVTEDPADWSHNEFSLLLNDSRSRESLDQEQPVLPRFNGQA